MKSRMEDKESLTLLWLLWFRFFLEEMGCCVWQPQMCSWAALSVWHCTQIYKKWELLVSLSKRKNTLLEPSKTVATTADLSKTRNILGSNDVNQLCTCERAKTKWKIHKPTNVTFLASLYKQVSTGCKNAVFSDLLSETESIFCLTFELITR